MIGLNVGAGQRFFKTTPEVEWINVDKIQHEGMSVPDLLCDGASLPLEDNSVDYFVLNHVYEHFGLGEADNLVREAFRVLKSGGSLIVTVPDMRELAIAYLSKKLDNITYAITMSGAYMGYEEDRHKFCYDRELLTECLSKAFLWREIKPFDWRDIPGSSIPKDYWILGCECVK